MIIDEIRKLEEIKRELAEGNNDKKLIREYRKLQKIYTELPTEFPDLIRCYYTDKVGNLLVVMADGTIHHHVKASISVNYLSFQYACLIFALISLLAIVLLEIFLPEYAYIGRNCSVAVNALAFFLMANSLIRALKPNARPYQKSFILISFFGMVFNLMLFMNGIGLI